MKLGFSTIGCPEWDWAEILGTAKDMGIDGIEIRGVEDELDPMKITIFDKEHLAKPASSWRRPASRSRCSLHRSLSAAPRAARKGNVSCSRLKTRSILPQKMGFPLYAYC